MSGSLTTPEFIIEGEISIEERLRELEEHGTNLNNQKSGLEFQISENDKKIEILRKKLAFEVFTKHIDLTPGNVMNITQQKSDKLPPKTNLELVKTTAKKQGYDDPMLYLKKIMPPKYVLISDSIIDLSIYTNSKEWEQSKLPHILVQDLIEFWSINSK